MCIGLIFIRIFLYSTTSQYTLKAFPSLSEDYSFQASKITSAFTGDPSFFAYNGEEEEEEQEDPDAPPIERFREIHRLAYTVQVFRLITIIYSYTDHRHIVVLILQSFRLRMMHILEIILDDLQL